jgi:single-stranded DNA-binding protein
MGRLGADPELKGSGDSRFLSLRVATSQARLVGREWKEDTEWHTVKVWGESASRLCMKAKKGTLIHIVGKLTSHIYQERRMWEIRAREWKVVADGRQTQAQPYEKSSPYNIDNFMMDLSSVATAKPVKPSGDWALVPSKSKWK